LKSSRYFRIRGETVAEVEKGPPEKLIDGLSTWKATFDRLRNRFGAPVAILLVLTLAGGLVWWNWDDISKRPGIIELLSWLSERPIPKVQPGHLTIALAHLEDDKDNGFEKLIEDTISSNNYADLIKVDRTINAHHFANEHQSHEYAVAEAKNILLESGCDIVLWGTVIGINDKSAVRLNWTMANNINMPKESERYEISSVSLPSLFDDDLKNIIKQLLQSRQKPPTELGPCAVTAGSSDNTITCNVGLTPEQLKELIEVAGEAAGQGRLTDQIRDLSEKVGVTEDAAKTLLKVVGEDPNIPDDKLAETLSKVAHDYRRLQAQVAALSPDNPTAVALVEHARSEIEAGHFQRAHELLRQATQAQIAAAREAMNLGAKAAEDAQMLGAAGSTAAEGDVAMTERRYVEAALLFEQAAGYVPSGHAGEEGGYLLSQAGALYRQGADRGDNDALKKSIGVIERAFKDYPRSQAPLQWAGAQMSLGNSLATLGERESGTEHLNQAIEVYRRALAERTRDRVPLDWAATQTSLGNVLLSIGERDSGTSRLEEAVAAYRAALEERTRERVPLDWAQTQTNLASALAALGERQGGTAGLEEAIAAYRAALEEGTRERVPLDWAQTQASLASALAALGERQGGTARLEEAVAAYRAALEERTRDLVPLDWARSFGNQGVAMMLIADRTNDGALAETAAAQIQTAYQTLRDRGDEYQSTQFQSQLTKAQAIRDRLKGK
jgi:hypothetical protein